MLNNVKKTSLLLIFFGSFFLINEPLNASGILEELDREIAHHLSKTNYELERLDRFLGGRSPSTDEIVLSACEKFSEYLSKGVNYFKRKIINTFKRKIAHH